MKRILICFFYFILINNIFSQNKDIEEGPLFNNKRLAQDSSLFLPGKRVFFEGTAATTIKYKNTSYYKYDTIGRVIEKIIYDTTTNTLLFNERVNYVISGDTNISEFNNSEGRPYKKYNWKTSNESGEITRLYDSTKLIYSSKYLEVDSSGYIILSSAFSGSTSMKLNNSTRKYFIFSPEGISNIFSVTTNEKNKNTKESSLNYYYRSGKLYQIISHHLNFSADTISNIYTSIKNFTNDFGSFIDSTLDEEKNILMVDIAEINEQRLITRLFKKYFYKCT